MTQHALRPRKWRPCYTSSGTTTNGRSGLLRHADFACHVATRRHEPGPKEFVRVREEGAPSRSSLAIPGLMELPTPDGQSYDLVGAGHPSRHREPGRGAARPHGTDAQTLREHNISRASYSGELSGPREPTWRPRHLRVSAAISARSRRTSDEQRDIMYPTENCPRAERPCREARLINPGK